MRNFLTFLGAALLAIGLGWASAYAQNVPYSPASGVGIQTGHEQVGTLTPTVSACGTSPSISGDDMYGQINEGTGTPTSCTLTFNTAFKAAPYCVVSWQTSVASMAYAITATTITLTQTGSSGKVNYACRAQNGG